jgi:hypothetical protein
MTLTKLIKNPIQGGIALIGLSFAVAGAISQPANATTITFDPIAGNVLGLPLNAPFVEGDFTYQAINNTGGDFSSVGFGNPLPALSTFEASNGDTVAIEFFLTGGGLFTFDSFESIFSGQVGGTSDAWSFFGEVGGTPTQLFSHDTSSTSYITTIPTFTAPIDKLIIQFALSNEQGPLIVDNLVLTPAAATPEPATILGLVTVGALGALSRKRKG